mmetsp:Transcript_16508/g.23092  ORF Transcript_16508/g.23092 Transcript_16508/m.23092 type:complete len:479 (+) Transcript_16508:109-1545(+)|eukprot:CAMPEP_0184494634 /NCGR_PEP_ID=MMETSP0113_2-20130426/29225_1 /TAXON_ID=91329 /ORGANISM="Norrisiella sphaerica, Strain BC52" /LENGTH=478 /DNA_ID=CAMNT_0026880475 /DNA_START=103 /DNA_END=1539 /DNA_ORIENTATION=+
MASILTAGELDRIKNLAINGSSGSGSKAKGKKSELKKKSESRSQRWPNTLENARANKLKKRQERLDEIERKMQKIDEEEAKYRDEERQRQIQRAQDILYSQKDSVKQFNASKLLSEAMKQQQQQIELKKNRERQHREQEKMFHKMQMDGAKRLKEREEREAEFRARQAKEFAAEQKRQLAEFHERERLRKEEEAEIGRKALALAKQVEREAEEAQLQRLRDIEAKNKEKVRDNQRLELYKKELQRLEREEEKKIEMFAKMKEDQLAKRKRDQAAAFQRKQEIRQKIIDDQTRKLAEIKSHQKNVELQQTTDAEAKRVAEEKAKTDKRNKLMNEIHRSRQQQLLYKQQRREKELEQDKAIALHARQKVKEILAAEKAERMAVFKKNKELSDYLLQQSKERRLLKEQEVRKMLDDDCRRIAEERVEDERLCKYVSKLKKDIAEKGLDPAPLDRMARKAKVAENASKGKEGSLQSSWTGPL